MSHIVWALSNWSWHPNTTPVAAVDCNFRHGLTATNLSSWMVLNIICLVAYTLACSKEDGSTPLSETIRCKNVSKKHDRRRETYRLVFWWYLAKSCRFPVLKDQQTGVDLPDSQLARRQLCQIKTECAVCKPVNMNNNGARLHATYNPLLKLSVSAWIIL